MADEKRNGRENRPEQRRGEDHSAEQPQPREPYRKPGLKSGERLEKTALASCLTGPQLCGPFAIGA